MKDNLKHATFLVYLLLAFPVAIIALSLINVAISVLECIEDTMYCIKDPKETKFYYWMGWK